MHFETEITTEQKTSARQDAGTPVTSDDVPLIAPGDSSSTIGSSSCSSGAPAVQHENGAKSPSGE